MNLLLPLLDFELRTCPCLARPRPVTREAQLPVREGVPEAAQNTTGPIVPLSRRRRRHTVHSMESAVNQQRLHALSCHPSTGASDRPRRQRTTTFSRFLWEGRVANSPACQLAYIRPLFGFMRFLRPALLARDRSPTTPEVAQG